MDVKAHNLKLTAYSWQGRCLCEERELGTKKKWKKPKLIVLIRSRSEERVLSACKVSPFVGAGGNQLGCQGVGGVCVQCGAYSSS